MCGLYVCLFGRFCARHNGQLLPGLEARKVQELFSFLLLHQGHGHVREALGELLWSETPSEQARKRLRHTLWQLQTALEPCGAPSGSRIVRIDDDWVCLSPDASLWLDVTTFEAAYARVEGASSQHLSTAGADLLREAVQLYQGDLLEGSQIDWCLCERERLRLLYLTMLDKLMGYCEAQRDYEAGLGYGLRLLACDRASERTHQRMMRLQYLAGDRTAALRQYEQCVTAMAEEFDVGPSRRTQALFERIRSDRPSLPYPPASAAESAAGASGEPEPDFLRSLKQFLVALADLQRHVQQQIDSAQGVRKHGR
jgi:DNA-binding SARP family transcriptional activator